MLAGRTTRSHGRCSRTHLIYFFFFFVVLGLEHRASPWATPPAHLFVIGFFKTGSHKLFASWVARITGVSHWHLLYLLSPTSNPFCSGYFGDGDLMKYLNHDLLDFSLPSSYNYRCESPTPGLADLLSHNFHQCLCSTQKVEAGESQVWGQSRQN
jgi:hypothetical protein